jgi:hypothetical protein
MEEFNEIMQREFGSIPDTVEGLEAALESLGNAFETLESRLWLANARIQAFDLDDIEDPIARAQAEFNEYQRALAQSLPTDLGLSVARLDFDTIDAWVQGMLDWFAEDPLGFAAALGDVSPEEFFEAALHMERLGDEAEAAADGLSDLSEQLRNVPSGFKVALAQFKATTGEALDALDTTLGPGFEELLPGTGMDKGGEPLGDVTIDDPAIHPETRGGGGGEDIGRDSITGNVFEIENLTVVADNPEEFMDEIHDLARREARRGGVTNSNLVTGGTGSEATKGGFRL